MPRTKPKADKTDDVDVHVYLDRPLADVIRAAAKRNARSLSSEVKFTLRKAYSEQAAAE